MLSNLVQLAHQIENKVCRFICDNDTPIHFIKEALFQFQKHIGQVEDAAKAQQTETPVEPIKPVEAPIDVPTPVAPEGNEHV